MAVRGTPSLSEAALLGEYPFLPGAEALVAQFGIDVRGLLSDPTLERARTIGRARLLAAADDPRGSADIAELDRASPEERFLSFLYARLVLSAASPAPLRRWAVAEAKRAHLRLSSSEPAELREVAERLGFPLGPAPGERVTLSLTDYVRLAVPIREAEFRLAAQDVTRGVVELNRVRAARLLQEAVRAELARPMAASEDLRAAIREREGSLLAELARRVPLPVARAGGGPSELRPAAFPPCIRKMRRTLEAGENLSHAGRFALAAFLHRAGADTETIVDAYRGAPDFDESTTRYQVDHITHRDGGMGYEPPECATLRSHGLCAREGDPAAALPSDRARDPLCFEERMRHPLLYYRLKGGRPLERDRPSGEAPEGATAGGSDRPGAPGTPRSTGPR